MLRRAMVHSHRGHQAQGRCTRYASRPRDVDACLDVEWSQKVGHGLDEVSNLTLVSIEIRLPGRWSWHLCIATPSAHWESLLDTC